MICVFALTRLTIYIELVKHWVTVSEEIAEAILIQTIEESTASSIYSIWFLTSTFLYAQKRTKNLQKTTSIIWLAQSHSRKSYIVYSYILKLEPSKLTPTLCCNNYTYFFFYLAMPKICITLLRNLIISHIILKIRGTMYFFLQFHLCLIHHLLEH